VCGSIAFDNGGTLANKQDALDWFRWNVGKRLIIGANIAYDNSLMAATDPELLGPIFDAYERGLFSDVQIRAMLNHIGCGLVTKHGLLDPETGGMLMDPARGKKAERMSLATVLYLATGDKGAKKNADWRFKYARLENVPIEQWPYEAAQYPVDDAVNTLRAWKAQKNYVNLHNEAAQLRAAWAMRLATVWGLRTDPDAVAAVKARVKVSYDAAVGRYQEIGFRREDGSENTAAIARAVANAYGDTGACTACSGTGRILSATQPKRETTARRYVNCKACSGSGIALDNVPRTPAGGVKCDRDTLEESGNEILEGYANVSNDEKFLATYIPVLERASCAPLNPDGNVLVASGRTSYDGVIQLIPRGGGLRECFTPRDGWTYCSIDYSALELATLAQVCIWVVGWSRMADAINERRDLHTEFAASMLGQSYDSLLASVKAGDRKAKGMRQAAKACNFGFPGGMGEAKMVATQRRQAQLRFCITLGEAPECGCSDPKTCRRCHGRGMLCGQNMITEWKGRECPPICLRCVQLATELRAAWFRRWPEMQHYFKYISRYTEGGSGVLEQFVSKRVRGGLDFCNGANTLFQGLAADGAKHALWKTSKECYTQTDSPMFGARPVIFVHDEIFSEIPCQIAPTAADRMTEVMINAMSEYVPDVRISAEPTLMSRWYKSAECKRSPSGELLVWSSTGAHYSAVTGTIYQEAGK
jgi:hypothetical protein